MKDNRQHLTLPLRRLAALVVKETLQALRDPSTLLIAVVLPVVLLFLFAYAVSLDVTGIRIGLVQESSSASATSLAAAFRATSAFHVTPAPGRKEFAGDILAGKINGLVVIPDDFEHRLRSSSDAAVVQVVTDGISPNTAQFIAAYSQGVATAWNRARLLEQGGADPPLVTLQPRYWYNPEIESNRFLVPGAIAIVMTMIGTLLTALVIAREWERGTMEAILATPVGALEILLGKVLPYFGLGLVATICCTLLAVHLFDVPLRGSWPALLLLSSCFLVPALGQGMMISTLAKNQFIASQAALFSGFLPAFMLSGFLYEISSMPLPLRILSHIVPARYFVATLQTLFLSGDIWSQFIPAMAAMLAVGTLFFTITAVKTHKRLDR